MEAVLDMKIWFNKVNESRRSMVEVVGDEVHIGRDPSNDVVLRSPLVSRHHAVVRLINGELELENVGVNSCLVGEDEVLGGSRVRFPASREGAHLALHAELRDAGKSGGHACRTGGPPALDHGRPGTADPSKAARTARPVRHGDVRTRSEREHPAAGEQHRGRLPRAERLRRTNEALLEEITGLAFRDHLINQLIMETGNGDVFDLAALTSNEFDVPATLVPERETELHGLLQFIRERLELDNLPDVSSKIHRVEQRFAEVFHLVRPHLHQELRKYLILRMLKKDLKDIVFGFGPLQDLLRRRRSPRSWWSAATRSTSNGTA